MATRARQPRKDDVSFETYSDGDIATVSAARGALETHPKAGLEIAPPPTPRNVSHYFSLVHSQRFVFFCFFSFLFVVFVRMLSFFWPSFVPSRLGRFAYFRPRAFGDNEGLSREAHIAAPPHSPIPL